MPKLRYAAGRESRHGADRRDADIGPSATLTGMDWSEMQPDDMPPPPDDALRAELDAKGIKLGDVIGLAPVPGSVCDAEAATVLRLPDGTTVCRCIVCPRCGHHTGNANQGHYWQACKVLAGRVRDGLKPGETLSIEQWMRRTSREDFHFCCGNEFGCELEAS